MKSNVTKVSFIKRQVHQLLTPCPNTHIHINVGLTVITLELYFCVSNSVTISEIIRRHSETKLVISAVILKRTKTEHDLMSVCIMTRLGRITL